MKKTRKIIFYVISAMLLLCYLYVLKKSLHYYGGSYMYEDFYIRNEHVERLDLGKDFPEKYRPGKRIYLYESRNLGKGWDHDYHDGVWTVDEEAVMYFFVYDESEEYCFNVQTFLIADDDNMLYVNEKETGKLQFDESGFCSVKIPAGYLKYGENRISIVSSEEGRHLYVSYVEMAGS